MNLTGYPSGEKSLRRLGLLRLSIACNNFFHPRQLQLSKVNSGNGACAHFRIFRVLEQRRALRRPRGSPAEAPEDGLDTLPSSNSQRNYTKALDDVFAFSVGRSLTRELLMEYRASINNLSASTIDVRLSAIRKMVSEARRNGMLSAEDAAHLTESPNIRQKGTRLGNWLTREQAKELLAVPDR